MAGGWNEVVSKILSNTKHSVGDLIAHPQSGIISKIKFYLPGNRKQTKKTQKNHPTKNTIEKFQIAY